MNDHIEIILKQWVKGEYGQAQTHGQQLAETNLDDLGYAILLGILELILGNEGHANEIWLSLFEREPSTSIQEHLNAIAHSSLIHRAFQIAEVADRLSLDLDLSIEEAAQCYLHLGRAIAITRPF